MRRTWATAATAAGEEAALLLFVAFMFPLAILVVATPVVLLARLLIAIAARL